MSLLKHKKLSIVATLLLIIGSSCVPALYAADTTYEYGQQQQSSTTLGTLITGGAGFLSGCALSMVVHGSMNIKNYFSRDPVALFGVPTGLSRIVARLVLLYGTARVALAVGSLGFTLLNHKNLKSSMTDATQELKEAYSEGIFASSFVAALWLVEHYLPAIAI